MATKTKFPDRTGMVPFLLFGIFALIVGICVYKGTHHPKVVQMEEDVMYISPKPKL
jgi:hypothetical protein